MSQIIAAGLCCANPAFTFGDCKTCHAVNRAALFPEEKGVYGAAGCLPRLILNRMTVGSVKHIDRARAVGTIIRLVAIYPSGSTVFNIRPHSQGISG